MKQRRGRREEKKRGRGEKGERRGGKRSGVERERGGEGERDN